MKNIALIFAGGVGKRMNNSDVPKQFIEVNGKPIIIHTLEHFQNNEKIDEICVVCLEDYIPYCEEQIEKYNINKVSSIIKGGTTGQDSIYNGLIKINETNDNAIVLIHDGVRPLIDQNIINDAIECARTNGSAVPCVPCTETIVNIKGEKITNIPNRSESFVAQAPQAFVLKEIIEAHQIIRKRKNKYEGIVDSCTLYKELNKNISIIDGLEQNIKITTKKDIYLLNALLDYKK